MATHNNLLKLQESIYLEVISIDHGVSFRNAPIYRPRWFSLDEKTTQKKLEISVRPLCWVVAVNDIIKAKSECGYDPGRVITATRDDLEWRLTVPDDGTLPEGGILPSFIQWPNGCNPSFGLPFSGVKLKKITLVHPKPDFINGIISNAGIEGPIEVKLGKKDLTFELITPSGKEILLSNSKG